MKINLEQLISCRESCIDLDFYYTLDKDEIFESYDIVNAKPLHFLGKIYKKNEEYIVELNFSGNITFRCNRCLEEVDKEINGHIVTKIKLGKTEIEDNEDDSLYLEGDTIELSALVNEAVILSLPMKVLCKEDCKGLCPTCGENLNINKCKCNKEKIDPRLEKLKNFFSNNEEV
ncbi:uncharacterized protein SAMN02745883_00193 [Caminicella sporogenes DSM 14501]|uniref:DUF177 domain-containing protein n=1 Tax=Caminicella sporogenes DSM 14501 TaxID=1121266 RepID=A0A1M6LFZ3_9FIRM|nr:DUF177 domain-containing protein [Caminicella sporogenes]RKD27821.1 hypothetical protein BET04_01765 [Caminicella sporogenes]WIF94605.1 DUF177 domain-containing protein [Caminicella sporogenes]SHJ70129.1 uncharacterized protein SAMN02745883_00193 [Caminicella sporogenes DSM 14501]